MRQWWLEVNAAERGVQGGTTLQSTVLVGADGNLSTVRKQLLADGLPRYAGLAVWRAMG